MAPLADALTLDNFASRLPTWSPELPNHLYAMVDMGRCVNGIRFSISDLSPPHARLLKCLYRERAAISLFDALNDSSSGGHPEFPPDVITQVSKTLARYKHIAVEYGVPLEHISVFATEAMRKASNAVAMLDSIRAATGLTVHVLAPEVETLFGAMGARSGFSTVNGLFLDLGGGSVQMTYLNSTTPDYAIPAARTGKSLPFGAARLINDMEKSEVGVRDAALNELRIGMRHAFARLEQQFPPLRDTQLEPGGTGVDIYLCGGGFRGYGSILMHSDPLQPYPIPSVGAYMVKGGFFRQTSVMRKINAEYEGKIFGMSKRRRSQFPAIAAVVEALIDAIPRIRTVTFCGGGNREGVLLLKLPQSIREACPLSLLPCGQETKPVALKAVVNVTQSALPPSMAESDVPTVFSLGLGPLFASEIWSRMGESSEANASFHLRHSLTRDSSAPGLTHLARAVLALTLCFRWGASLGPVDKQLFDSLQSLVSDVSVEAIFWAQYIDGRKSSGSSRRLQFALCHRRSPAGAVGVIEKRPAIKW
ncbi:Ppx/GppA phosphatase family-domain-containing protein [Xylariaceae sp. FL0594]|nr:Ppx/GppA phosphatase family-domain-containing protein [Xylariaceae sp. FL0594]